MKKSYDEILTINDPSSENIYGVINRMENLLDRFRLNPDYHNLIPFLYTYYLVTKTVARKRREVVHFFDDFDALQRLDVVFAKLYFEPLREYLDTKASRVPWRSYFEYCKSQSGSAYLQMLLGINAHINADLTHTLVTLNYERESDFNVINLILKEEIPPIMSFLAFNEGDILGMAGMLFKNFFYDEFEKTVVRWRGHAWDNSRIILATGDMSQDGEWLEDVQAKTEILGQHLVGIFHDLFSFRHIRSDIKLLNDLAVQV